MIIQEIFSQENDYPEGKLEEIEDAPFVGQRLGSGSYAAVYEDKTNPHNVVKIGKIDSGDPQTDGYLSYLNKIKRLNLPIFPRVDSIQIFKNVGKHAKYYPYFFVVRMEKLFPKNDLSSSEIASLFYRFFGEEKQHKEELVHMVDNPVSKINVFLDYLKRFISGSENIKSIPDRGLRTAVVAMKSMSKRFNLDFHADNIMFRKTPYGVQPVVTDPLSYKL